MEQLLTSTLNELTWAFTVLTATYDVWPIAAAICGALSALCVVSAVVWQMGRRGARERLVAFALPSSRAPEGTAGEDAPTRLATIGQAIAGLLPAQFARSLNSRAERAGYYGAQAAYRQIATRCLIAIPSVGLAIAFLNAPDQPLAPAAALILLVLGLAGTDLVLKSRADARRQSADRDLPTLLDLLALSMAAGMSFDLALETILHRLTGPLATELRRYLQEIGELGVPRDEALLAVAHRLSDSPDLVSLAEAIASAHALGTGLVAAVESQSTLLRGERRRRAAAAAQRAPVRMLIPMTLFMLPVLMMMVLAPVALRLSSSAP